MAAYIFDELLAKGIRSGQIPARTQSARDWFRKKARVTHTTTEQLMSKNKTKLTNALLPGNMMFFSYSAKHADTLPYYDKFPLIFPFDKAPNGFYGINMHYLPLRQRATLMDALYDLSNNNRYDENTKLNISWKILKAFSKSSLVKPTVHRYLSSHVRSRFMVIDSVEWDIALFLPLERFVGASKQKVWADSRKKING